MDIRLIRNDEDHTAALKEIERLWDAEPGTLDGDKLEALATLVEAYEDKHWPIAEPKNGHDYLMSVMDLTGRTRKDLANLIGSSSHASEIISRDRALSLSHIRLLASEWGLSADTLVKAYPLVEKRQTSERSPAKRIVSARQAGRRAAQSGKSISANPYTRGPLKKAWDDGFVAAARYKRPAAARKAARKTPKRARLLVAKRA